MPHVLGSIKICLEATYRPICSGCIVWDAFSISPIMRVAFYSYIPFRVNQIDVALTSAQECLQAARRHPVALGHADESNSQKGWMRPWDKFRAPEQIQLGPT